MTAHGLEHPCFAPLYSYVSRRLDDHGGRAYRQRLLAPLGGLIIEIGAGNGLNLPHYPAAVRRVLAIEPESRLRAKAVQAAAAARVPVDVVSGRAEQLPLPDGKADGAVLSLVLCSIADRQAALDELNRVLRPGGVIRFFEHVRSPRPAIATMQHVIRPVWRWFAGGCQLDQDAEAAMRDAGFAITELDRFDFAGVTHILGTAAKQD